MNIHFFQAHLFFYAGYLSPLVSAPTYYILVSYQSQNYGMEPSLISNLNSCLVL